MKTGENDFDCRDFFFRVHPYRNATAVVFNADTAIGVQGDVDVFAIAANRFVRSVIDDFGYDMKRVFRAGVHPGALAYRFKSFQNLDRGFAVTGFF